MIKAMVLNGIKDALLKKVAKKYKLQKLIDYVEKPNDADDRIDKLELKVHQLEKESHPPIFTKKEYRDMLKRIKKLEKKEK